MQQDNYIQSRSTAIESIESTIAELGQIFTQLAGMVAEQRETVQRIDADTTDIAAYVFLIFRTLHFAILACDSCCWWCFYTRPGAGGYCLGAFGGVGSPGLRL